MKTLNSLTKFYLLTIILALRQEYTKTLAVFYHSDVPSEPIMEWKHLQISSKPCLSRPNTFLKQF